MARVGEADPGINSTKWSNEEMNEVLKTHYSNSYNFEKIKIGPRRLNSEIIRSTETCYALSGLGMSGFSIHQEMIQRLSRKKLDPHNYIDIGQFNEILDEMFDVRLRENYDLGEIDESNRKEWRKVMAEVGWLSVDQRSCFAYKVLYEETEKFTDEVWENSNGKTVIPNEEKPGNWYYMGEKISTNARLVAKAAYDPLDNNEAYMTLSVCDKNFRQFSDIEVLNIKQDLNLEKIREMSEANVKSLGPEILVELDRLLHNPEFIPEPASKNFDLSEGMYAAYFWQKIIETHSEWGDPDLIVSPHILKKMSDFIKANASKFPLD